MGKGHRKLSLEERERFAILQASGKSLRAVARILGRSHTTLSREWKRNQILPGILESYTPIFAQFKAEDRASLSRQVKRIRNRSIRRYVTQKLRRHWSPEQISGRIQIDHPGLRISHEAIYQFVYRDAVHLIRFLPRKHQRRRPRYRRRRAKQLRIPSRTFIDERPDIINQRHQVGHWESDSLVSRANSASLHLLHERKSRLIKLTKLVSNSSSCVRRTIIRRLKPLPRMACLSITYDNGSENMAHLDINRQLKTNSFFCQPYHSWEKGAVENSAGLVRRFLPKRTDFQGVSLSTISRIEYLINTRPRKCLNYLTPKEVFNSASGAISG